MGKPFAQEMGILDETYQWSLTADIDPLTDFCEAAADRPIVAVGSGGSLTAAHVAVILHRQAGKLGTAVTPLELKSMGPALREAACLVVTAGGKNHDVLSAYETAARAEPRELLGLCMSTDTPLATLAAKYQYSSVLEYAHPARADGFLATNSLIAMVTLLTRAYSALLEQVPDLPKILLSTRPPASQNEALFQKSTWLVLYSHWSHPAAIDLESKFSEAGLGHVSISDYRNFAHGRHHWLAKRPSESAVLALVSPADEQIARKTLALLPKSIVTAIVQTRHPGPTGTIELLARMFDLVAAAGQRKGVDPGRPGVPTFGRKIYSLRPLTGRTVGRNSRSLDAELLVIQRKAGRVLDGSAEQTGAWRENLRAYLRLLHRTPFGGIVLDYDGTLCSRSERFTGMCGPIGDEIRRLHNSGLVIGVVTGRGKSVRQELRRVLETSVSDRVLIGYYNGHDIGTLEDDSCPPTELPLVPALAGVKEALSGCSRLREIADWESRPAQISVFPQRRAWWSETQRIVRDLVARSGSTAAMVKSTHSIDIIPQFVSKAKTVHACSDLCTKHQLPPGILCIGDSGQWPGNDHALLASRFSLSVDSVSPDPMSCWNLAQPGRRGVQATIDYLQAVTIVDGAARFRYRI